MNTQPFDPLRSFQPPAEPASSTAQGHRPFFDRAGLAWIVACVAIAVAAGRWIPPLSEPGAWGGTAQAAAPAVAASAAATSTMAAKRMPSVPPLNLAGDQARPAKTVNKLPLGMF